MEKGEEMELIYLVHSNCILSLRLLFFWLLCTPESTRPGKDRKEEETEMKLKKKSREAVSERSVPLKSKILGYQAQKRAEILIAQKKY